MQKRSESSAGRGASAASQERVEQVAAYLRANIDVPIRLSTLCEVAGLSERALREAFYHVHGMSPKRWMLAERLQNVRQTLTNREAAPISVTVSRRSSDSTSSGGSPPLTKKHRGNAVGHVARRDREISHGLCGRAHGCLHEIANSG